ncbi:MAG: Holliday junction resolvase RuvX [Leptolyngbya sp.]|nr:Holliday junction resolvase RuvX [Leptolyngbya sp.]
MVAALGLDIGRKRIGVAGCDRLGLLATELTTLEGLSFAGVVDALQNLVQARQVQVLVVGLPYAMDGTLGRQAQKVQSFAQRLSAALSLPVEYVDERLTSYQAEQMLWSAGKSPVHHKALVDQKAAAIILQQWLDQRSDPSPSS